MTDLPPLPKEAASYMRGCNVELYTGEMLFTADQMREYGAACAAAEREACEIKVVAAGMRRVKSLDLREEVERLRAATALCDQHQPNGGARGHCVICSGIALSAALSKISYLCGPPNEMECGPYDLHCDENAVVAQVEQLRAAAEQARAALSSVDSALELGLDALRESADRYHAEMKGYRPERHQMLEDDYTRAELAWKAARNALRALDEALNAR